MKYRARLPQLNGQPVLTDGGLETTLVFLDQIELPGFAAIHMLTSEKRREHLERYFEQYVRLAHRHGMAFQFESVTWRSSHGWAEEIGLSPEALDELNRTAIGMLIEMRERMETPTTPLVISGCIGPRGDGYVATDKMTVSEAAEYHGQQVRVFEAAGVDCVSALTMNYVEEAAGIALAAKAANVPSVISFTVETDGRLATGESLGEAVTQVDELTGAAPAHYMINCAHPSHFAPSLSDGAPWTRRIAGIRANASSCSHAELDNAEELDIGDPDALAEDYAALVESFPHIKLLGGCCGTDIRHIEAIVGKLFPLDRDAA